MYDTIDCFRSKLYIIYPTSKLGVFYCNEYVYSNTQESCKNVPSLFWSVPTNERGNTTAHALTSFSIDIGSRNKAEKPTFLCQFCIGLSILGDTKMRREGSDHNNETGRERGLPGRNCVNKHHQAMNAVSFVIEKERKEGGTL